MNARLSREQRIQVHRVHPAKLAMDISASVLSSVLLWKRVLVPGLVARYLLRVLGSAVVLRYADVDRLASSARGRYVQQHRPPIMRVARLAGDTVMAIGAWRRRTDLITLGVVLVVLGWSHGLTSLRIKL
jgi:hypothetical protein